MKFQKIDRTIAEALSGTDMIVVYDAGSEIYLMGSVLTNRSMSLEEALDLIGWDEETMDEMTSELGWDGWDYEAITDVWDPKSYLRERGFGGRMLQYRANNAYSFMIVFDTDHAEAYMMDGSEDFPILTDKEAAERYLRNVAAYIDNLDGADYVFERDEDEQIDDFLSRICADDEHSDEIIAEIEIG